MKHINRVSRELPAGADAVGFIFCETSRALNDLLGFKGGESPVLGFVQQKCNFPDDTTGIT